MTDQQLDRLKIWAPYTDIFCLGGPDEDDKAKTLLAMGEKVAYYSGGPEKATHPIGVSRRNFWRAFHLGLAGQGTWSYCCSGWQDTGEETAWTELDTRGRLDASMIYRGKYGPVTSKRWEAWRDGVEDYMLLTVLKKAFQDGLTTSDPCAIAAEAVVRREVKEKREIDPLEMALFADMDPSYPGRVLAGRKALLNAIAELK